MNYEVVISTEDTLIYIIHDSWQISYIKSQEKPKISQKEFKLKSISICIKI